MAQFRSSAREGSFSNNQIVVPDTAKNAALENQRIASGMRDAADWSRQNRDIQMRAMKQSQGIEQESIQAQQRQNNINYEAQTNHTQRAYALEIQRQENEDKYKVNLFSELANFSKTAFNTVLEIKTQNKENQLKAINQIAFKHKLSHKDLVNAKSVNSDISKAAWQETQIVKDYLAEGRSQEFINMMHDHLIKGGGYMNYIENSNVIREQATINARVIDAISNDPNLTPEQKRKKTALADARMRGELSIGGRIIGEQLQAKAYNPTMRRALDRAELAANTDTRELAEAQYKRNQAQILHDAAMSDGTFNFKAALDIALTSTRPNAIEETVAILLQKDLTSEQLDQMLHAPYEQDGKMRTIYDSNPAAVALINTAKKTEKKREIDQFNLERQEQQLSTEMAVNQRAQELATDDGLLDNKDYRELENFYYENAGYGADPRFLERFKRQTVDQQLIPVMRDQLEEMRLNRTLSEKELLRINPPKQLYDQYIGAAQSLDAIKATPQYKQLNTYLEGRILGAIKEVEGIKYSEMGRQTDQLNWYVGEQVKESRKKIWSLVEAGTPIDEAMEMIGNSVAESSKKELRNPESFTDYDLNSYTDAMAQSKKRQLIAQGRVTSRLLDEKEIRTKLTTLTRSQQNNPTEIIKAFGEKPLMAASKQLAKTGQSQVLNIIAQRTGMTAYQVQAKIAEVSDLIEPVEISPTYAEIQESWSKKQKYAFTSNQASNQQQLRLIQQRKNEFESRNSFQARETFQPSGERYQSNGTGLINRAGNNDVNKLAEEGANLINSLTDQDYNDLAYAISSEAKLGTDDEFGVAANILTRLLVGGFGSSISEIINAPGQYEGVYNGSSARKKDSVKQAIAKSLKSDNGKLKLLEFIKKLDGRAYFKGQTQLKNRVPSEDPMFAETGNFYHR